MQGLPMIWLQILILQKMFLSYGFPELSLFLLCVYTVTVYPQTLSSRK